MSSIRVFAKNTRDPYYESFMIVCVTFSGNKKKAIQLPPRWLARESRESTFRSIYIPKPGRPSYRKTQNDACT